MERRSQQPGGGVRVGTVIRAGGRRGREKGVLWRQEVSRGRIGLDFVGYRVKFTLYSS